MSNELLSVAGITTIVALLFTLVFQYAPVLRVKWGGLKTEIKQLVVLGLYIVVGAVVAFGGCVEVIKAIIPGLLCVEPLSFLQYVFAVVIAVGAGQGVFSLLPEKVDVTVAKAERGFDVLEIYDE